MNVKRFLILSVICICFSAGCHRNHSQYSENTVFVPPPAPEGTEKYCWQEPKVIDEKNGPGLDEKGHWYHPPYNAVREVKMGKWVPCAKTAN